MTLGYAISRTLGYLSHLHISCCMLLRKTGKEVRLYSLKNPCHAGRLAARFPFRNFASQPQLFIPKHWLRLTTLLETSRSLSASPLYSSWRHVNTREQQVYLSLTHVSSHDSGAPKCYSYVKISLLTTTALTFI